METTQSTTKYWLIFFISLAVMIFMLCDFNGGTRKYFWTILPFVCTSFAKGLRLM